jgi:DNA-binding XRE family transcriptional regulator
LWYSASIKAGGFEMTKKELSQIRYHLGKTQLQMAQLLGVSLKAIQSFEQGWRKIPISAERQSLLLFALKESRIHRNQPCWKIKKCPEETRQNCPAWEFNAGHMCWLINGTICHGKVQKNWPKKMDLCKKCEVFQSMRTFNATQKP